MHRVQSVALVVAVLAGVGGGTYGLTRVFGAGATHPIPGGSITPSPSTSPTSAVALCSDQTSEVTSTFTGAAGTIRTLWQVKNTAISPCRSNGYPKMDFHTSSGWLNVRVHHGGFGDISQRPRSVVVPAGKSLYFVSYWHDVDTQAGPCQQFDRVRVTLPGNQVPAEAASTGCVNPDSVDVGPLTKTPSQ